MSPPRNPGSHVLITSECRNHVPTQTQLEVCVPYVARHPCLIAGVSASSGRPFPNRQLDPENLDVVCKYQYLPFDKRPILLFYRGRVRGGRVKLHNALMALKRSDLDLMKLDISDHSLQKQALAKNSYVDSIEQAKFCFNPRADWTSSVRLFDSILSGCLPVIVNDGAKFPFEDQIDYSSFALFFQWRINSTTSVEWDPGELAKRIVHRLDTIQPEEVTARSKAMQAVRSHFLFLTPEEFADVGRGTDQDVFESVIHSLQSWKSKERR